MATNETAEHSLLLLSLDYRIETLVMPLIRKAVLDHDIALRRINEEMLDSIDNLHTLDHEKDEIIEALQVSLRRLTNRIEYLETIYQKPSNVRFCGAGPEQIGHRHIRSIDPLLVVNEAEPSKMVKRVCERAIEPLFDAMGGQYDFDTWVGTYNYTRAAIDEVANVLHSDGFIVAAQIVRDLSAGTPFPGGL